MAVVERSKKKNVSPAVKKRKAKVDKDVEVTESVADGKDALVDQQDVDLEAVVASGVSEDDPKPPKKHKVENSEAQITKAPAVKATEEKEDLKNIITTFKSSLFRLQVTELLKEVSVDYSKTKVVEAALHSLKAALETLPEDEACFNEKDYLNHKYHAKRSLYLDIVARHLAAHDDFQKVEWSSHRGDVRKPILVLTPDGQALATPQYNASILEDVFMACHLELLHARVAVVPALRDAILLLKVWARQRGYHDEPDSMNGFLLSILAAHLATPGGGGRVNGQMTSYQIFRVVMDVLAAGTMLRKGVFLQGRDGSPNQLALKLTADAKITLACLEDERRDNFDALFMRRVDFSAKFDYHVRVSAEAAAAAADVSARSAATGPEGEAAAAAAASTSARCLDEAPWRAREARVEALLKRALGDRARLVRVRRRAARPGPSLTQDPVGGAAEPLLVGIQLAEPEVAFRMADKGPSADDKTEARKFRAFWGEKSELRRFQDGTINETAVWECSPSERHLIIPRIVEHILARHLSLPLASIQCVGGQLDWSLLEGGKGLFSLTPLRVVLSALPSSPPRSDAEVISRAALNVIETVTTMNALKEAYEKLSKSLRSLQGLPLSVVSVQTVSPALRGTCVYPPGPHALAMSGSAFSTAKPLPACIDPVPVVIQLEGSGKWPDEPEAVRMTKLAFLLKIADSMEQQHGVHFQASEDCVDLLADGYAFRVSIAYEKDPTLLDRSIFQTALGLPAAPAAPGSKSWSAHMAPQDDAALRCVHSSTLHGLQGMQPLYGPVTRLAKRWVACHMLGGVVGEEALELLTAHLFTRPAPFAVPRSRIAGFLRFLTLLSTHDWATSPLVVDVNDDLSAANYQAIQDLKRIVAYARRSAQLLQGLIHGQEGDRWKPAEELSPSPSDASLLLSLLAKESQAKKTKRDGQLALIPKSVLKASPEAARDALLIGFDPTEHLVHELQVRFGAVAKVWHDALGGVDAVGLSWRPQAFAPGPLKPATAHLIVNPPAQGTPSKKKDAQGAKAGGINLSAVLDDMRVMGDGYIEEIYLNPARRQP
eukprot:jgi/Mesen1/8775/ME000524S08069